MAQKTKLAKQADAAAELLLIEQCLGLLAPIGVGGALPGLQQQIKDFRKELVDSSPLHEAAAAQLYLRG